MYDGENRLVSVQYVVGLSTKQTTFVYDGLNRLREQLFWSRLTGGGGGNNSIGQGGMMTDTGGTWTPVGGVHYIYDGNRVIQERDTNNTPTVSYTRGNDLSGSLEGAGGIGGLLARSDTYSAGNFTDHNYYHADGNGNITYLETSAQGLAASYRYDAFGNLLNSSGTYATANTYRFSSKEWVATVNGYYYLYRFYLPGLQRWPNRDPLFAQLNTAYPKSRMLQINFVIGRELAQLYSYCFNDSVNHSDLDGSIAFKPPRPTPPGPPHPTLPVREVGRMILANVSKSGGTFESYADYKYGGDLDACIRGEGFGSWPGLIGVGILGGIGTEYGGTWGGVGAGLSGGALIGYALCTGKTCYH